MAGRQLAPLPVPHIAPVTPHTLLPCARTTSRHAYFTASQRRQNILRKRARGAHYHFTLLLPPVGAFIRRRWRLLLLLGVSSISCARTHAYAGAFHPLLTRSASAHPWLLRIYHPGVAARRRLIRVGGYVIGGVFHHVFRAFLPRGGILRLFTHISVWNVAVFATGVASSPQFMRVRWHSGALYGRGVNLMPPVIIARVIPINPHLLMFLRTYV